MAENVCAPDSFHLYYVLLNLEFPSVYGSDTEALASSPKSSHFCGREPIASRGSSLQKCFPQLDLSLTERKMKKDTEK